MKICVFGTGAVGGHVAVRLAKGGAEVSVVARPAVVNAIRARGLLAKTTEGDVQASVTATSDTRDLGPHDFVFVTAKAPSLPSVAAEVAPLLGSDTAVVFAMKACRGGTSTSTAARWTGADWRKSIPAMRSGPPWDPSA